MPFGLVNAPASFQAFSHEVLKENLDQFVVVYLDDILIFSKTEEEHSGHVRWVLDQLRKWKLHANLSKCIFHAYELDFLGYILSRKGIAMDPGRIFTVTQWPEPKSHREVQVFLGFANFYRRFIKGFSRIVAPITSLLKGGDKGRFRGKFVWTDKAKGAFEALKIAFTSAPMLLHFDPARRIKLETDASDFALSGILSQLVEETGQWHPIAFWSRKMTPAEINYGVGEKEMLAIVEACKNWRHYLEGANFPVKVLTDHGNLRTFFTTKTLSRREARWWERLSSLDLQLEYRPGRNNPADGPSRRPDYAGPGLHRQDEATLLGQGVVGGESEVYQTRAYALVSSDEVGQGPKESFVFNNTPPETRTESSIAVVGMDTTPNAARASDPDIQAAMRRTKGGKKKGKKPAPPKSDETAADSKPVGFRLVEAERDSDTLSQRVLDVTESEAAFASPPLELSTVLRILQETDHLAKRRRPLAASSLQGELDQERDGQRQPTEGTEGVAGDDLPADEKEDGLWHLKDDILCRNNRWYIPPGLLRNELLKRNHDDPSAEHFGTLRTTELLQRKYYWPRMVPDVKHYVDTCTRCHQVKAVRHRPFGELESLPVPLGPRQNWTLDFITDLPPSIRRTLIFDAILVIVDRYTKYARYIAARKDWTAENLADALVEEVFTRFGMPVSLVTNRGSLFTSNFWSNFCYHLRVRLNYSTAFHPQTDGQTERQNQTLEQYLRCYVNYQQDDWVYWLPMAEYAYNNSRHSVLKMSPFEALFGEAPRWEEEITETEKETPAAKDRAIETLERDVVSKLCCKKHHQIKLSTTIRSTPR